MKTLPDPALAREIAARFGLGDVTGPMRSLSRPDEAGRRWLLLTDRGHWAHLLTHLPSAATYERVLDAATALT